MNSVYFGDNLSILKEFPSGGIDLIYIDPPFGLQRKISHTQLKTKQNELGDRKGFGDKTYSTEKLGTIAYNDIFDDYIGFLEPRLSEGFRILSDTGSFFLHLDYREVHYAKILMDRIFSRSCFMNEIIWMYDFGGRSKKKWSAKHDNILWYVKNPKAYTFNYDLIDRIPYMAPGLVGPEKAAKGKTLTDCWWQTIVPTNSKERTGYPTQKPIQILERIVRVHSNPDDICMDFFAGAGSFGEAAMKLDRSCILIDNNLDAISVMKKRFSDYDVGFVE